jgi:hypothetical protein
LRTVTARDSQSMAELKPESPAWSAEPGDTQAHRVEHVGDGTVGSAVMLRKVRAAVSEPRGGLVKADQGS